MPQGLESSVQELIFMVSTFHFLLHFPFFSPPCFLSPGANKLDYHLLYPFILQGAALEAEMLPQLEGCDLC